MAGGDLLVYERVQVEKDTLQVDDKDLRGVRYAGHLRDVALLLTELASVIVYHLTEGIPVEGLRQVFGVLYFKGD